MIQRDYVLRQIQQLAQALAYVLTLRRQGRSDEAEEALEAALLEGLGHDADALRRMDRAALVAACAGSGPTSLRVPAVGAARALAVADLLAEDAGLADERGDHAAAAAGFRRARWLYESAVAEPDAALPFDYAARIARWAEAERVAEAAARG